MKTQALKVLQPYTNRNVYPIGRDRGDGSFDIVAEVNSEGGTPDQAASMARLMAAAPVLFEALQDCITNDGAHCLAYGADTPALRRRLSAISNVARAALEQAR